MDCVDCIVYSPDGKLLASGSRDMTIRIWNIREGKEICQFFGGQGNINSMSFSSDGKYLACSGDYQTITIWNMDDGKQIYL